LTSHMRPLAAALTLFALPAAAAGPVTVPLDEALREVERQSPTAAQARGRAEEASALVRQVRAALLPTLSATAGYTRNSDAVEAPVPPSPFVIQPLEFFSVGGSLRVPIAAPQGWADLSQARHAAAAADAGADATRLQLRLAVVQAAWLAAEGAEATQAAERALAVAADQARSARRAVDAGIQPPLAALQAEAQALQRESDLVRTRAAAEKAELALGVLLGRAERVRVPPPAAPAGPPPDPAELGAEALRLRPETRAQAEQVAAAHSGVTSAWLRLLPQLSASAAAFAQDVPLPTREKQGWRATVDLTWSLYDGGFRYGKRQQAQAQLSQAQAGAEALRLAVLQEVEDAVRDLQVSSERLRLAEKQRAVAADAAAVARRGFQAGTTGNVDVLDANDRLFQAELAGADARARAGVARAALDRAVGRL